MFISVPTLPQTDRTKNDKKSGSQMSLTRKQHSKNSEPLSAALKSDQQFGCSSDIPPVVKRPSSRKHGGRRKKVANEFDQKAEVPPKQLRRSHRIAFDHHIDGADNYSTVSPLAEHEFVPSTTTSDVLPAMQGFSDADLPSNVECMGAGRNVVVSQFINQRNQMVDLNPSKESALQKPCHSRRRHRDLVTGSNYIWSQDPTANAKSLVEVERKVPHEHNRVISRSLKSAPCGISRRDGQPVDSISCKHDDQPLYVNAKQYERILKRREARAKLELEGRIPQHRKKFMHRSRHEHALKRVRGEGGRFAPKQTSKVDPEMTDNMEPKVNNKSQLEYKKSPSHDYHRRHKSKGANPDPSYATQSFPFISFANYVPAGVPSTHQLPQGFSAFGSPPVPFAQSPSGFSQMTTMNPSMAHLPQTAFHPSMQIGYTVSQDQLNNTSFDIQKRW